MRIGLIDVDSKIPNLALMKISKWHKIKGDIVEWYSPLFRYDKVYASKIFKNSKYQYLPKNCIIGGTGFNPEISLPKEIEFQRPDYSLYPNIDYAMGYLTRGCDNNCPFCIVPKKEGKLYKYQNLEDFWNGQSKLLLLDNSLTDYPQASSELIDIRDNGIRLNLTQGFNIRTISSKIAGIMADIKLWNKNSQWHFAWDNPADETKIIAGLQTLNDTGIKSYRLMCYILVGFNTTIEQDLYRIKKLDEMGIDPFVMRFRNSPILNSLAKWTNRPQLRKSCKFEDFSAKKSGENILYV